MTLEEINKELEEIRQNLTMMHTHCGGGITGKSYIDDKQREFFNKVVKLFRRMSFNIALQKFKHIKYGDINPINQRNCGRLVKIKPCKEGINHKTYLGIFLGEMALSVSLSLEDDDETLLCESSQYNPAIFVPELKQIIFGCESFWGEIESEADLEEINPDDVWYVKLLKSQFEEKAKNI